MNETTLPPDRLLTRAEVEVNFGLSRRFLEISAYREDGPPMIKIGRSVRYRVSDLRRWIDKQVVPIDVSKEGGIQ